MSSDDTKKEFSNVYDKYRDQSRICTGSKESVRVMTIRAIFNLAPLEIPIFQRRYCWRKRQWTKFLQDVVRQIQNPRKHAFNRIQTKPSGGKIIIIDGQQRLTTCAIFLSAVQDIFHDHACTKEINDLLFPSGVPNIDGGHIFGDGMVLDSALIPSYFDRLPFYRVLLHQNRPSSNDQLNLAYQFFKQELSSCASRYSAKLLIAALLDNCTMLNFQIADEDILTVYELMAVHSYTWERSSTMPGISLAETDLIKNFLLSKFDTDHEKARFYSDIWLVLEHQLVSGNDQTSSFELMFYDFIEAFYPRYTLNPKTSPKFDLYNQIRSVVAQFLSKRTNSLPDFLNELLKFSKSWSPPAESDA